MPTSCWSSRTWTRRRAVRSWVLARRRRCLQWLRHRSFPSRRPSPEMRDGEGHWSDSAAMSSFQQTRSSPMTLSRSAATRLSKDRSTERLSSSAATPGLGPRAQVRRDVTVVGGALTRDPGATIGGEVNEVGIGGLNVWRSGRWRPRLGGQGGGAGGRSLTSRPRSGLVARSCDSPCSSCWRRLPSSWHARQSSALPTARRPSRSSPGWWASWPSSPWCPFS